MILKKLMLFLIIFLILISCKKDGDNLNEMGNEGIKKHTDKEIIFLSVITPIPFWDDHKLALNDLSEKLGIKTSFIGPETWDLDAEIKMLYEIAEKKPYGILLFAADDKPSLGKAIDDVIDMGIPIINIIQEVSNCKRLTRIGISNYKAGRAGGEELAKAIGGKGEVIMGSSDSEIFHERVRGYRDVFKEKYPRIKIVDVVDDKVNPVDAPKIYLEALKRYPNVVGIGGVNAESGKGAARAVLELGLKDKVKIIGMDRDDKMLTYLKEGVITATIVQKSYLEVNLAVNLLLDFGKDLDPVNEWENKNLKIYPDDIDMGVWVVNNDNVDIFINR